MKKKSYVNTILWILAPFITIISLLYILEHNIISYPIIVGILVIPYIINVCYFIYSKKADL
ncbi:hypothetical protein ABE15_22075 [Bacillus cereus]|nr:hypothetical protein [Bacillus cereus]